MDWGGLVLSLLLIALAAGMLLLSRRWQRQSGLPDGSVIYSDSGTWFANSDVLYDSALRLAGKPDYLVEQDDGGIIPVEYKSSPAPQLPWPGHVLQLIAYCRLVESAYGVRPDHGILQYKDRAFSVEYTPTLEHDLLDTLDELREDQLLPEVDRDHGDPPRCIPCGYRRICDQSLN